MLDDARVQRMFDGQTNAMLRRNAHYVTMRHTVGVEDLADYERRVKEFEATGRGDPTEFMTAKIVRTVGRTCSSLIRLDTSGSTAT